MNVDYQLIRLRIKQQRKKRGLAQEQLAERVGVSVGYISQIERGITRANPEMLAAICTETGCSLSYLFDGVSKDSATHMNSVINEKIGQLDHRQKHLLNHIIDAIIQSGQAPPSHQAAPRFF